MSCLMQWSMMDDKSENNRSFWFCLSVIPVNSGIPGMPDSPGKSVMAGMPGMTGIPGAGPALKKCMRWADDEHGIWHAYMPGYIIHDMYVDLTANSVSKQTTNLTAKLPCNK